MIKQLIIGAALLLFPVVAWAQGADDWESYEPFQGVTALSMKNDFAVSRDFGVRPEISLLVTRTISETGGVWLFAAGTTWSAQSYGGLWLAPTTWLKFGFGMGLETEGSHWRLAALLDIETHDFHLIGIYENGASGRWHHLRATYQVGDHFLIGLMSQRGEGEGPLVGTIIDFVEVRLAYLYDTELYLTEGREVDVAWWGNRFWTAMLTIDINILPLPN